MRRVLTAGLAGMLATGLSMATPSTNIWNPTTDVQAKGTFHLGIDNYFSIAKNRTKAYGFPTDVGLTYGPGYGFEIGIDVMEPTPNPITFNAKWALPENKVWPAFAVGVQGVGIHKTTQSNIFYALLAKTWDPVGRITAGGYKGKKSALSAGRSSGSYGAIVAWDRSFGDKWWASVDYASGNNLYGEVAFGGSYKFAKNVSVLASYVVFTRHSYNPNNTFSTQLDIDF